MNTTKTKVKPKLSPRSLHLKALADDLVATNNQTAAAWFDAAVEETRATPAIQSSSQLMAAFMMAARYAYGEALEFGVEDLDPVEASIAAARVDFREATGRVDGKFGHHVSFRPEMCSYYLFVMTSARRDIHSAQRRLAFNGV